MSNFNVRLIEDRDNIFRDFQEHKRLFLKSNRIESREAVCLMLKAWELVSKDLWEQGYWQDYFRCGDIVLRCTTVVQGDVLNQIGWNYMEEQNFALAISYFQESLKLFESMGYLDGQCESLRYLGVLYHRQRRFGSALKSYRKALNIIDRAKINTPGEPLVKQQAQSAEIHNLLGNLYFKLYDFNASRDELTLSLNQYRSLGNEYVYYQPAPLLNLGRWYFLQGNYRKARIYYKECLQISHKINRTDTKVGVLTRLAELANAEGDCRKATKLTERAQRIAGKEIRIQRDKVARLQEEFKGIKIRDIHQIKARLLRLFQAGFDLAFYAPLTLLKFILYYFIRILKFRYIAVVSKMRSRYNT